MNRTTENNFLGNAFQKVEKGKCRIAMNGQIAVWTTNGYKTFSVKNGTLTNCASFVAEFGDDFFYVVPAARVKRGDIILVNGTPRCVIKSEKNLLTVMTYETGSVETIIPERHMFMGNVYFHRKIVAPMAGMFGKGKGNQMIRMMMMSDMMKGSDGAGGVGAGMGNLMQILLMQGMMKNSGGIMDDFFMDTEEDAGEDTDEAKDASGEEEEEIGFLF